MQSKCLVELFELVALVQCFFLFSFILFVRVLSQEINFLIRTRTKELNQTEMLQIIDKHLRFSHDDMKTSSTEREREKMCMFLTFKK